MYMVILSCNLLQIKSVINQADTVCECLPEHMVWRALFSGVATIAYIHKLRAGGRRRRRPTRRRRWKQNEIRSCARVLWMLLSARRCGIRPMGPLHFASCFKPQCSIFQVHLILQSLESRWQQVQKIHVPADTKLDGHGYGFKVVPAGTSQVQL